MRPFRGARLAVGADGLVERCRAYARHRRLDFAFSHTTAALLLGVPLPPGIDPAIHVSVPAPGRAPEIAGFVGHKLTDWATTEFDGLPLTTPAQTWIDLASLLPVRALVVAGDHLVAGGAPLSTREALAHRIAASAGRRGIARARQAIEQVRAGSESPGETRLRLLLVEAGLPMPQLNREIHDGDRFIARVDLAYPSARVALEYEGDIHRVDRDVWRKDIRRRERLEDLGWRMVRVTADDIAHPAELLTRLRRLLRA
ncbi:endonuclease domain-containing protein [Leifsonia aquatica]|uniref:endonuclease domain-containing protein n=1 Tax=Leifsonia aquatica TaxID=144185 RepID=UPI001F051452|nr:endonuclease domain-containing protein [Leifsonia aquatica]